MNLHDLTININFSERTIIGVCIASAAVVFLTFVLAIWQWHSDWMLAHQKINSLPLIAKSNQTADVIAAIPNEHLFGKSMNKLRDMPITNLQLRVTGIVKVDTEQSSAFSKAYISIAGGLSKIYQVSDNLPYGVKVYDITSNAVILENDGHLEKLPLPREQLKFKLKHTEERS